jgi:hypothetical protein
MQIEPVLLDTSKEASMDDDLQGEETDRRVLRAYDQELAGERTVRRVVAAHEMAVRLQIGQPYPSWPAIVTGLSLLLLSICLTIVGITYQVTIVLLAGLLILPFVMWPVARSRRRPSG